MKKQYLIALACLCLVTLSSLHALTLQNPWSFSPSYPSYLPTRETFEFAEMQKLQDAVDRYAADNSNTYPAGILTFPQTISSADLDICSLIVPTYISYLPTSSYDISASWTDCTNYHTGYTGRIDANGRFRVESKYLPASTPRQLSPEPVQPQIYSSWSLF